MASQGIIAMYDQQWRAALTEKGYQSIYLSFEFEPVNDQVRVDFRWHDTEWSSTYLSKDLRKSSFEGFDALLGKINDHILALPDEHEARDEALLRDFAKIKERIGRSRIADLVKAEAQALMDAMTTNILPPPSPEETAPTIEHEPTRVPIAPSSDDPEEYLA